MTKKKTAAPTRFAYFDKYLNREVRLQPKSDEMVVTVEPIAPDQPADANESVVRAASSQEALQGVIKANYARGIAVLKVAPERESLAVASAKRNDQLLNAIPAFVDSEGLTRYFVPDEITVQFEESVSEEEAKRIIEQRGSSIVVQQRTPGYYTISVPEGADAFATIESFNQLDSVEFAEMSEIGFDDDQENPPVDERFTDLWGLHNVGQVVEGIGGKPGADISVLKAWETTRGNENVVIVVIDTGTDLAHEDLAGNLLMRGEEDWDFEADDGSPDDSDSHGTHVCGTAAAMADNGSGIAGVAPECALLPLRINLQAGMNANRADAINFAGDKAEVNSDRRYVINCSWISSGSFSGILRAIDNAVAKGAVVVFAAGNAGRDMDTQTPQYPGVHLAAICVAALTSNDTRAAFSNFGSQVDVSAPGQSILSTVPGNQYQFKDGTSMAAPHVSGTLALIWSANMSLRIDQVRSILESTCDEITGAGPELAGKLGYGRVNAAKAVLAAQTYHVEV